MENRHLVAECVFGVIVFQDMDPTVNVNWKKVRDHLLEFKKTDAYERNEGKIKLFRKFEEYLQAKNFYEPTENETEDVKSKRYSFNYNGGYFDDPLVEITKLLGLKLQRSEISQEVYNGPMVFDRIICGDIKSFCEEGNIGIIATKRSTKKIEEFRRIFRINKEAEIHAIGRYIKEYSRAKA